MSVRIRLPNPLDALDDRALLARFAEQHDQPAFAHLVKRHGGLVLGVCRRAVRDRHLAEDAFQAVFLVLARDPRRAAAATSVGGWLYGVAWRVGRAARRHERRREARHLSAAPERETADAGGGEFDDLNRVLDEELAALPDAPRAALVACFLEERTQDQAARELGWSLSTLRRRLDRGKELLRARLARRGVTLGVGLLAAALPSPASATPSLAPSPSPAVAALAAEVARAGGGLLSAVLVAGLVVGALAHGSTPEAPEPPAAAAHVRALAPDRAPAASPPGHRTAAGRRTAVIGRVVFPLDRALPAARPVPADLVKDADVWARFGPLAYEDTRVRAADRGLADVVVFLRPDSDDRRAEFSVAGHAGRADPWTVRAEGGHFAPRVLAVRAGDRVTFDNRLPVPTNVLYAAAAGDAFNVLLGTGTTHTTRPLPAHQPDRYASGIYPWMTGTVWAFGHPYFAVTGADGTFRIANAPAGACRLVAWHETAGYRGGPHGRLGVRVVVPESDGAELELGPLPFDSEKW
jgi:RNA polymerase sigma factor (sigma-70 family)